MAEELARLVEAVTEDKAPSASSSGDRLSQRLRLDSVKLGLEKFYSILRTAVEPIADDDHNKLGFQRWDQSQIQSVSYIALALASATRSLSVEHVDPIVIAAVQKSMEFALCFLDKSDLSGDDLSLQNNMVQLIESAALGGTDNEPIASHSCSLESLANVLQTTANDRCQLEDYSVCLSHGSCCSSDTHSVDRLLMMWSSECLPDAPTPHSEGPVLNQDLEGLGSFCRHYATVHLQCRCRLLSYGKRLIALSEAFDEVISGSSLSRRLSLCSKVLALLRNLTRIVPYVELDPAFLQNVSTFAEMLPGLFRPVFEFVNSQVSAEGGYEGLVLTVLEEFLNLVQQLPCDAGIVQNIRACIIASILRNLDSTSLDYSKSAGCLKVSLVYFPRCVLYIVKLLEDLKKQLSSMQSWKNLGSVQIVSNVEFHVKDAKPGRVVSSDSVSVLLCRNNTLEELLKVIFPSHIQWLDNLMNLLSFLHSEGVNLRPKLERLCSSVAKAAYVSESENTLSHEDEALFGDLFSEGGRSAASNDGYEQLPLAATSASVSSNIPFQAATQLLSFLRSCVLSPEWSPSLYQEACCHLNAKHIDLLLYILNNKGSHLDDVDGGALMHEQKLEQLHEVCFQLLYSLVTNHALSDELEDYLVQQILKVENGIFVYNDQTLALLAHAIICRRGSAGHQLRKKVYLEFVKFIVEKGNSVSFNCNNFKDLLPSLPSMLHIEILLVAFHLSSQDEKVALADIVFSSLNKLDFHSATLTGSQLSCWAMLVSPLDVVLFIYLFNIVAGGF